MKVNISVGELSRCWQSGDINFRFSSRSSAVEGIRGHQLVQKKRGSDYISEKPVEIMLVKSGFEISIQGRVDGFMSGEQPPLVEEIKTVRVPVEQIPESIREVHLAQLKLYAYMLSCSEGLKATKLRLCYLDLEDNSESHIEEIVTADELGSFFESTIDKFVYWLVAKQRWSQIRDESIGSSSFPYPDYRSGQRDMAVAAYRSIVGEQQLVLQAPTGIGKTMATIFPAVKAIRDAGYDKLFYLSAKTSGQQMAEDAVQEMNAAGFRLRSLTLTAKDKICFNPGSPCDPEHCEYAKGYYDRLDSCIEQTLEHTEQLNREKIEASARVHRLCPFELSLDIARFCDLIICDYNYVFDPAVYLRRFFENNDGKYSLLIDEAHNLVDRGRSMYSAELLKSDFLGLRRQLKEYFPFVARRLAKVNAEFLSIRKKLKPELETSGFAILPTPGEKVVSALRGFCEAAEDVLKENSASSFQENLLTLYFDCLRFLRTAEQVDDDYAVLMLRMGKDLKLKLFCINPATRLKEGFDRMASSICFSATMRPQNYFHGLLGLEDDANWYQLQSPFDPDNLGVFLAPYIGTSFKERDSSIEDLVDLINKATNARKGNYLVFFPSHAYLQKVHQAFVRSFSGRQVIAQKRNMDEEARSAFINQFREDGQITGFAVMGGVFGEGIDLKGTRLIGVIVTGVGLPQLGVEQNLIRDYWNEDGVGFEFAYQYPGMNRVLQTAGRVIRGSNDKGIICLVDRRFNEPRYRDLFPVNWQVTEVRSSEALENSMSDFWGTHHAT
jgi:DNA excision repair protein ERCC-2